MTEPDFSGYATRNNIVCTDGRTILAGAFEHQDGEIVPLVWEHNRTNPENILGHVRLKNVEDGVRAEAFFNQSAGGVLGKEMVRHGDVKFLSIFANNLIEQAKRVSKGVIREVSLVVAGANPGAVIDNVAFAHSDGTVETYNDEAVITTGLEIELSHADTMVLDKAAGEKTLQDILDTLNPEQEDAVNFLLSQALTVESVVQHSDEDFSETADNTEGEEDSLDDSADEVDESDENDTDSEEEGSEIGDENTSDNADTEDEAGEEAVQHNNQEDNSMTHNVFDQANGGSAGHKQVSLSHSDVEGIVASAIKGGSLKDAVEDYALQHGIENIDYLFPDARSIETSPAFVSRRMEWVDKVLSTVRKTPFSRIKTITADITPDEARARGYIKGNMKNEEFFALSKRETTPQTIYKKQKLDRDDVIDIVDLDVVAWLKAEMKVMLDEELAGAILMGDGRSIGDDDKIKETNIRPIATDAELYVTTVNVNLDDANSSVEELVDAVIAERKNYKGTGQPTFYTTEGIISAFLTVKDNFGRRIYTNLSDVASVLRVTDIIPVEVMERDETLVGIMVNLADYTLGADRGGQATMFDDFDIDYNKLRYLIETRVSGALTQPKSALVFRKTAAANVLATPKKPDYNTATKVITIPTVTGVDYFVGDGVGGSTGTALTAGDQAALTADTWIIAKPKSGYYFKDNVTDEWLFKA